MQAALDRWCARALRDERRDRREAFRRHVLCCLIALTAVTLAVLLRPGLDDLARSAAGTGFRDTVADAVAILIWVALWTPFTAILVAWVPYLQRRRAIETLSRVRLEVRPDGAAAPGAGAA